jgi:glycerophosphoryl diester phosphodiesterase
VSPVAPFALVAHRGNALEFPENTLPAFESALQLGVRHVELDVQLSSDGVPIVLHDAELERTTGIGGKVFEYDADTLATMAAGEPARFGSRYAEVRMPRLSEALALVAKWPEALLFVEIKTESLEHFGQERVVKAVTEQVKLLRRQCVVISFDLPAVQRSRQLGGVGIGWVLTEYDQKSQRQCALLDPQYVFCNHRKLPASDPLWSGGWRWACYEVRDPALARSLTARGVALIETMAVRAMSVAATVG